MDPIRFSNVAATRLCVQNQRYDHDTSRFQILSFLSFSFRIKPCKMAHAERNRQSHHNHVYRQAQNQVM